MKTMKYLILSIIMLVLGLNLAFSQRIDVKISLPKNSFLENESIFLITEIKNITSENIEIARPFIQTGSMKMIVKDSKGKSYHCNAMIYNLSPDNFLLMASSSILSPLELVSSYGVSQGKKQLKYFSEGAYTVHAIYYVDERHLEKYESNELIFYVEKPEGNELYAFEEYNIGYCEYMNDNFKKSAEIFEKLCKKFPNSTYIPDAYSQLQYLYVKFLKDTTRATYFAELLLDYPNNVGVSVVIPFLSNQYSKADKEYMIDSIKQKHKNTFLEKMIDDHKNEVKLRELREKSGIK